SSGCATGSRCCSAALWITTRRTCTCSRRATSTGSSPISRMSSCTSSRAASCACRRGSRRTSSSSAPESLAERQLGTGKWLTATCTIAAVQTCEAHDEGEPALHVEQLVVVEVDMHVPAEPPAHEGPDRVRRRQL